MVFPVKCHVFTSHMFSSCETFFTSPSRAKQLHVELMAYSKYKQQRILYYYYFQNKTVPTLKQLLPQEGLIASRYGIHKVLCKYQNPTASSWKQQFNVEH